MYELIGLILFGFLVILKREWGIYLIILLLPTYQIRFQIFGIPTTFLECMILVLAAVEIIRFIIKYPPLRASREASAAIPSELLRCARKDKTTIIFVALLLLAALISVFTSPVRTQAAGIFKAYFFDGILFYFLILSIINSKEKLLGLLKSFTFLVLYLSIFGIYQFVTLANLPFFWWAIEIASRRITSLLNHPNALALLLGPTLGMLIFLPRKKKLEWITIGLGTIAFYLTFSRAAWLALGTTILILSLFTPHKKKIFVSLVVLAIIVLIIPFSRAKLLELVHGNAPTQENRYVLWTAALDILKKHPVAGAGLMGFHEYYKSYPLGPDQVVQNYPHNFFLNFYLETGLLGLVSVIGLLIIFFKKIRHLLRTEYKYFALAAGTGMLIIILHGLVDVPYFKNDLAILFWTIFALPTLFTYIAIFEKN